MKSPREVAELTRETVEGKSGLLFADLFAEDGVMEFPFAPPGFWPKLEGQQAIREFYEHARGARKLFDMEEVTSVIHETDDPEVVITEIEHHGISHLTNKPYQLKALGIIRVRGGKIVHYRDYMNPIAVAELLGRTPDLVSALSAA
jgi:ketosteroid isomerase-like protein